MVQVVLVMYVGGGVAGYIVIGASVTHSTCVGDSVLVATEVVVVGFIVIGASVACVVDSVLVATEAVIVGGAVNGSNVVHMVVLCVGEAVELVAVGALALEFSHSQPPSSSSSCSSSSSFFIKLVDPTAVGINEAATLALVDN